MSKYNGKTLVNELRLECMERQKISHMSERKREFDALIHALRTIQHRYDNILETVEVVNINT